jgi:hypothetical protein
MPLIRKWQERLNVVVVDVEHVDGSTSFLSCFSTVRLRGVREVPCLIVTSDDPQSAETIRAFERQYAGADTLVITIVIVGSLHVRLERQHQSSNVILCQSDFERVISSSNPRHELKRIIRQQISIYRLNPYDILHPAEDAMFFGRNRELDRLHGEPQTSFAIAGPGRIGKTSLIRRYQRELKLNQTPRALRTFYVSFYACADQSAEGVVRHLGMAIDPRAWTTRMRAQEAANFFRYMRSQLGGPLELLLDEVDEVCLGVGFKYIGDAARLGLCRLIVCGRSVVLHLGWDKASALDKRIELLRLEPLEFKPARQLLLEPLADLGYQIDDPDRFVEGILQFTGRLPHLLQFFCRKLVEVSIREQLTVLGHKQIEVVQSDFETSQFFTSFISEQEIRDSETRLVAFLLIREKRGLVSPLDVLAIARASGLAMELSRAQEICANLLINCVLVWEGGSYRVANDAMAYYARQMGIDQVIAEVKSAHERQQRQLTEKRGA